MATRRVIAHCMHEHELTLAGRLVTGGVTTEGMVIGEVDEAGLRALEAAGIVVQRLDEAPAPALRRPPARIRRGGGGVTGFMGGGAQPPVPVVTPPAGAEAQYRVRLAGPLVGAWRSQLDATGAKILEGAGALAVRILLPPAAVGAVAALPFVLGVDPWSTVATADVEDVMGAPPVPGGVETRMVTYDVLLVDESRRQPVVEWLAGRHAVIAGATGNKVRIHLPEDSTIAAELQQRTDWVRKVEPYVRPALHNDRARVLLGVDGTAAAPGAAGGTPGIPFLGGGQVLGVADTGLDEAHSDFAGRVAHVIALGRPGDASDPHGHGTHVAGSVLGDGSAQGGQLRGVAPQATLVFQSLLDAEGGLGGLPLRLQDLFEEAYGLGVRIHNNSWGASTGSSYRISSREVDEFAYAHKDMLIVISAGNDGTAADPTLGARSAQPGFVDWLSIGSPATAKNALTVGASRSDRTTGGYAQLSHGAAWPREFPVPPISAAPISQDEECISGFSSRGPCDNYRIKPDVVAPGTDILSCRSSRAPLRNFWGPYPADPKYAFMGGTSMAAPLVAGCAALVREYYLTRRGHDPSAALLKATLINGTRWLSGADAVADHAGRPNYHQGFGCVHVPGAIPDVLDPTERLEFVDNWRDPSTQLAADQRRRWRFDVAAGGSLSLCLAYTDPPGPGLENNLNLLLEVPGGGAKLFGNMRLPMSLNQPDAVNNVEAIRIEAAAGGTYLVQVSATNILWGPQDFALAVTGRLTSSLQPV